MSPFFLPTPNKMCHPLESSSMSAISLNNTQIRTFINIYPPAPMPFPSSSAHNLALGPLDLRKQPPSAVSAQALYHFYFPHLFGPQNHATSNQTINGRDMKQTHPSSGRFREICALSEISRCHPFARRSVIAAKTQAGHVTTETVRFR